MEKIEQANSNITDESKIEVSSIYKIPENRSKRSKYDSLPRLNPNPTVRFLNICPRCKLSIWVGVLSYF